MKQRHRKSDVHGREAQIRLIANMSMTADSLPQSGYTVGEQYKFETIPPLIYTSQEIEDSITESNTL